MDSVTLLDSTDKLPSKAEKNCIDKEMAAGLDNLAAKIENMTIQDEETVVKTSASPSAVIVPEKQASLKQPSNLLDIDEIVNKIDTKVQQRLSDFQTDLQNRLDQFKLDMRQELHSIIDEKINEANRPIQENLEALQKDHSQLKLDFHGEVLQLNYLKTNAVIEDKLPELMCDSLNGVESRLKTDIDELTRKTAAFETQLQDMSRVQKKPLEDIEVCVVASDVPESLLAPLDDAKAIVQELDIVTEVSVVEAARLNNNRPDRPALLKFALATKEEKITVLRAKHSLKHSHRPDFRDIFLRTSMTKEERVSRHNYTQILKELDCNKDFRFMGSGKLVRRNRDDDEDTRGGWRGRWPRYNRGRGRDLQFTRSRAEDARPS